MFKEELAGTYWYCVNDDGSTWLVKCNSKPTKSESGGWKFKSGDNSMGWLEIYNEEGELSDDWATLEKTRVESKDFKDINFPERTYADGPLELEITKSGKVYWYD